MPLIYNEVKMLNKVLTNHKSRTEKSLRTFWDSLDETARENKARKAVRAANDNLLTSTENNKG